jgi:pimeloyl-ACP methyl ester carboxylesterase
MVYSKNITFSSDGNILFGRLYAPTTTSMTPGVLFIHGAGKASSERYIAWQEYLAERGFSSLSFDVRGVGKSEGEFVESGLNKRLLDAESALQFFTTSGHVIPQQIAVAGNSMGAHVATMLVSKEPSIKALLLCCAAAYAPDAEDKKLDETFTHILRRENSWRDSLAFSRVEAYSGKVFVAYGDQDEVIPEGIQKRYLQLAARKGEGHILSGIGHAQLSPKNAMQEKARESLFGFSASFLTKAL